MEISRENYELFFIDYLDGVLSDRQIAGLRDFLLINPDLREELEGMEEVKLMPGNSSLTDKDILRKIDLISPVSEENFDDYCAAYVEGDLNKKEISALMEYLVSHPEHKKDLELFRSSILSPDPSIVYLDKNLLKKHVVVFKRVYIYPVLAAAAAIAMFLVIFRDSPSPVTISSPIAATTEEQLFSTEPDGDDFPVLREENLLAGSKVEVTSEAGLTEKILSIESSPIEIKKQEPLFTETHPTQETEPSVIVLANINLPPVNFGGAKPDVIKGINIHGEEIIPGSPAGEPDYLSLPEIALKYMNNTVLKRENPSDIDPTKIDLWGSADAGIKGLNRLTGSEIKLEKKEGADGETRTINFEAGFFGFYRSLR